MTGDSVTIRVDVTNTGAVAGDEVVQLCVGELLGGEAEGDRPAFARPEVQPPEAAQLPDRAFGADFRRVVEPGRVSLDLLLRGPVVELAERRHYLTASTIE